MRKFVKFAKNLLPGEKNGRKIGSKCFIVVSAVEEIKISPIHSGEPLFFLFVKFLCKQEEKG